MSRADLVEVVLVGGPLDGETRAVTPTDRRRTFMEDLGGPGPLGFPMVAPHDYAPDPEGVWRHVPYVAPAPLPDDVA